MTTLSMQRTVAGVLESADSATITLVDSVGATIVSLAPVTPTSTGVYSYDTPYLTPGLFTATWVFVVSGQPNDVITRTFTADGPATIDRGVTLRLLEQRLARRIGPYHKKSVAAGSSTALLVSTGLKTSLDRGGIEELYILRRGRLTSGAQITNFNADDRQRIISAYDHTTGGITPDRDWNVAPTIGEEFELHSLDPEEELRPAVQMGLERCFFWDRPQLSVTGGLREYDLSSSIPWLTDPSLIAGVESAFPNSVIPAVREMWWRPFLSGGDVFLQTNWIGAVSLSIIALRPHSSYVNGETSLTGPNDDDDILSVDMEYALISAHNQCWINFTDRLTVLAALGLRLTAKQVSDYFNHKSRIIAMQQPEFVRLRWDADVDIAQVGNVGENPT